MAAAATLPCRCLTPFGLKLCHDKLDVDAHQLRNLGHGVEYVAQTPLARLLDGGQAGILVPSTPPTPEEALETLKALAEAGLLKVVLEGAQQDGVDAGPSETAKVAKLAELMAQHGPGQAPYVALWHYPPGRWGS